MKLKQKLVLGFLAITVLIWVTAFWAINISKKELKLAFISSNESLCMEIMNDLDKTIQGKIEIFRSYAKDKMLRDILIRSNHEFSKLNDINSYIESRDSEWRSADKDRVTPFMQGLMENDLARELKEKIEYFEDQYGFTVYGEVFVTNKYGANVAQTRKTSDYRQDDEQWWRTAQRDGFYIQDVNFDDSSGAYSNDVGIRIEDEKGNFIGVMKVVMNIEEIVRIMEQKMKKGMHANHQLTGGYLLTRDGRVIYSSMSNTTFLSPVSVELKSIITDDSRRGGASAEVSGKAISRETGDGQFLIAAVHSHGYRDYAGLGWVFVTVHDVDELFAPVHSLRKQILLVAILVTFVAVLTGIILSRRITKRILMLHDASLKIAKGDRNTEVAVDAGDEIGELASAFKHMTATLDETISVRDKLIEALEDNEQRFRSVSETASDAIISIDETGHIVYWNKAAESIFGYSYFDIIGQPVSCLMHERYREAHEKGLLRIIETGENQVIGRTVELSGIRKNSEEFPIEISLAHWQSKGKQYFTAIIRDVSGRKKAESELKKSQSAILQSEKMASIGQLAAGVAHEINNPMGFMSSNLGTLKKYVAKLMEFMDAQGRAVAEVQPPETEERLSEARKRLKIDLVVEDVHQLIDESLDGAERVKKIVQNLKSFSRVDESECKMADVNVCIESTLNIVWNELKYKAEVVKELGEIPEVKCYPQQLNQVFMNLLVNGAQAIEKQGEIRIKTWNGDRYINISISDTGSGIPEDKIARIFDPFFTTKDVGKGTGLGLSIAYDIVKKHHGEIMVESVIGKGTTFTVRIPLESECCAE